MPMGMENMILELMTNLILDKKQALQLIMLVHYLQGKLNKIFIKQIYYNTCGNAEAWLVEALC
jgi:hypothetical protein